MLRSEADFYYPGTASICVVPTLLREATCWSLTIERNPNLATILGLEVVTVGLDGRTMSNEERVADDPGLPRAVAFSALGAVAATPGSKKAGAIAENRAAPGLVEGDPIFYLGPESLETHPGVVLVILHKLVLVQHAPISLVQVVREIPMKQRYHGLDACGTEIVDQLDVVLQTFIVDGVVAAAERYDAGPREGKAVRFCANILQEGNVLVSAVVGIACNFSGFSACYLARDAAERVPNGIGTAIFMRRAFDLVTAGFQKLST
jgi:hypothetical protein